MKLTRRNLLVGSTLAAGTAAFACIVRNVTAPSCRNPERWKALEMSKARGCLEFWFNRYQTLIGAAVAAVVAFVVVRPAYAQLRLLRIQTLSQQAAAISATIPAVERERDLANTTIGLLDQLSITYDALHGATSNASYAAAGSDFRNPLWRDMRGRHDYFVQKAHTEPEGAAANLRRIEAINSLREVIADMERFSPSLDANVENHLGRFFDDHARPVEDEIAAVQAAVDAARPNLGLARSSLLRFQEALTSRIADLSRDAQQLLDEIGRD